MFGVGPSFEKSSRTLVIGELPLFKKISIPFFTSKNPFVWRCNHEGQFPNVAFIAKQILSILRSQIETKRVFNLARILIVL